VHRSLPRWATRRGWRWWPGSRTGSRIRFSQLTEGFKLTRQAVTKHLRVLEGAGIVHGVRTGRESLFEFDPGPIHEIGEYLDLVSEQWDRALARLKSFVED
jgi:DNA-binding transcriptional ArsR family regulator